MRHFHGDVDLRPCVGYIGYNRFVGNVYTVFSTFFFRFRSKSLNVTDGQTDGQTDKRSAIVQFLLEPLVFYPFGATHVLFHVRTFVINV